MCGIAGVLYADRGRVADGELLRAMGDAIAHRGPDAAGYWQAPGVGLVHRRLSIIDLAGGDQPIANEDECLVYPRLTAEAFGEQQPAFSLTAELQREVCPGHPLHRVACRAVARNREDPNEFLFATENPRMPLAFVHLTWTKEEQPNFPWVEGYESWDAFRNAWADSVTE